MEFTPCYFELLICVFQYHDEIQDKNSKLQGIQDKISETERQIEKSPESLREFMAESLNKV